MYKDELRRQIRQIKRQFTSRQLEELSLPVLARLRPLLQDAAVVMAYYSLPDEVNTHRLLDELVEEGKTVLLPEVVDDETMVVRRYRSRADLREGAFHIMEPVGELFTDYQQIDVVLVPGVAFDAEGHRLGRGRGYYDRFLHYQLSIIHCPLLLGLCFDFQKVPSVPVDPTDIPVNQVI